MYINTKPFRVVQRLLDIAVIVSLRDYWHFLKELSRLFADMCLNHASPRALPVLYNYSFLFWDRVTSYMHLNFEWSRDSALFVQILQIQSVQFPRVSNVVIYVNSLLICSDVVSDVVSSFIPAKKTFGIYQSTLKKTWRTHTINLQRSLLTVLQAKFSVFTRKLAVQSKICKT